jgi:hypothetical protein
LISEGSIIPYALPGLTPASRFVLPFLRHRLQIGELCVGDCCDVLAAQFMQADYFIFAFRTGNLREMPFHTQTVSDDLHLNVDFLPLFQEEFENLIII